MLNAILPHKEINLKSLFSFEKTPFNLIMTAVTILLLTFFFTGFIQYVIHGHHAYGVTKEHPWGLLIAMYIFFVVSSTGLCIISSLGHVFHIKSFEFIGKRAIFGAIITIVSGFCVIGLEIGHPIRMVIYNTISPGFTSAIWGMGALYSVYLFLIIMEFIFLSRNEHKWSKFFGLGGLLIGVAAHSNLGAVFGFLVGRPLANGVFYPVYFILSAMITGCYLLFLMYGYKYKMQFNDEMKTFLMHLGRLLGLLIAILIFFEFWRFLTAIYGRVPQRSDTALHILHSGNFWFGEVLLGMLIPFGIILYSKAKAIKATIYASLGGMIGIFFMRYDLVHDTLLYPMQTMKLKEYQLAPSWVEYVPTVTEWSIALGSLGICLALYYIGENFFFLDPDKEDDYFKHYVADEA
ncbi:MAG: polysulfide reductase NrfD [Sulfurospirillaceae bacterium]|nr:polysulfide reductase NrfD [Sulfurospirillaceae bacterium]